ncbi:MAG: alpha-L-fucosidase [Candidatus Hydrogenedentes bacterium]|nr:alpha-L-fucosidase [Candidatus Hydrogenedentota bacterium]
MNSVPQPSPTVGKMDWFIHDRFGMFIHWGLYAAAARHEWVKHAEEMSDYEYEKYFCHFDPDLFAPEQWARMAREAGMKYVVITAKHHEGFCLWDTAQTEYKATNTPFGKDLLRPILEAFRAEGLHVGFYYSIIDWHHPEFTIDTKHPMRNHSDAALWNGIRDMELYRAYMRAQVYELLTDYGNIDIIWFDFSYADEALNGLKGKGHEDWGSDQLLDLVRELCPDIIVNNRLDLPQEQADIHTPEQFQPCAWVTINGKPVHWETCQTFSGSWGYHREESSWKSPEQLVRMLVNSVSCGGNLLMNVGPTARGIFDLRAVTALRAYGTWMDLHNRAIYGCTQSSFEAPTDCRYTQNGNRLYLHLFAWPFKHVHLPGLTGKVAYAQLLNDASEVLLLDYDKDSHGGGVHPDTLTLELPVQQPDVLVPVVELFLK